MRRAYRGLGEVYYVSIPFGYNVEGTNTVRYSPAICLWLRMTDPDYHFRCLGQLW